MLREDLDANRQYRMTEPVTVPFGISVLHWADDPEVTLEELRGWQHYGDEVDFTVLDGGHYAFLSAPPPLLGRLADAFTASPGPRP
ncbi:hypothetical protein [Streptomyces sp. MST-110588]|uniref:hypothetical protein n=1 Tax=Streptomyces sp. MST-110588 TaxID=2833628 RepID=UPI001F5DC26B|nr:hypothetical protein [Streptomyces sp. MST-110588]